MSMFKREFGYQALLGAAIRDTYRIIDTSSNVRA